MVFIEGVHEKDAIRVIKCHKPQITSNNLKLDLKKMLRAVVACGPFDPPPNADVKKLLGYVLHEVRLWIPEFLIIMGPLIVES